MWRHPQTGVSVDVFDNQFAAEDVDVSAAQRTRFPDPQAPVGQQPFSHRRIHRRGQDPVGLAHATCRQAVPLQLREPLADPHRREGLQDEVAEPDLLVLPGAVQDAGFEEALVGIDGGRSEAGRVLVEPPPGPVPHARGAGERGVMPDAATLVHFDLLGSGGRERGW